MGEPRPSFPAALYEGETRLDWAERFYAGVIPKGLLTRKDDDSLWIAPNGCPPQRISTLDEFIGRMDSIYNVIKVKKLKGGESREIPSVLPRIDSLSLFYSEARSLLPELKAHLYEPAVFFKGGKPRVTPPGFDPETGIFYHVPPDEDPIEPISGTRHLEECFSAVPFEKELYRNNLFAWLLGGVFFDDRNDPPMLAITGNQRGVGKSKTQESVGYLLTGQYPCAVDHTSDEFDKQLSARFREGQRFISFDNIVTGSGRAYRNDRLARMLTQGWSKRVRLLGHSRTVEQKGVLFAINANDCSLDADLSSRALPVKLYRLQPQPMVPFCHDYVRKYRREIYGELLNIALRDPVPVPITLYPYYRYRRWLDLVYHPIQAIFGELAIDEMMELDNAIIDLYSWGNDQPDDFTFDAKELYDHMETQAHRFMGLHEFFDNIRSNTTRSRSMTRWLNQHSGKTYTISGVSLRLVCSTPGNNHTPPRFRFERLDNEGNNDTI
ncbi:MAG: hypothetical protein AMK69_11020 [Nitrospira bacterium SG8_3]|nr:MAG: hypothetical protein AMK69_11020 [Nitrospira bacterium SG8_3]